MSWTRRRSRDAQQPSGRLPDLAATVLDLEPAHHGHGPDCCCGESLDPERPGFARAGRPGGERVNENGSIRFSDVLESGDPLLDRVLRESWPAEFVLGDRDPRLRVT